MSPTAEVLILFSSIAFGMALATSEQWVPAVWKHATRKKGDDGKA